MHYDVFNGDADGICALVQLRLAQPVESTLVTGVKRDIQLLQQVDAGKGDQVTVLDVSMDKNKQALRDVLEKGAKVLYCDHHVSGDIPEHEGLNAVINTDANMCTSLLINSYLNGQYALWAITGAFGDNLKDSARAVARPLGLSDIQLEQLNNLGIYINYNGYGATLDDLHFSPAKLFNEMKLYATPFDFIRNNAVIFNQLEQGYKNDMASVQSILPECADDKVAVFMLPNEKWARRVSGVYSNDLANRYPDRAHAVLTKKTDGCYLVSVRAPLNNKQGAVDVCSQFDTGGGRAAAAGINDLSVAELPRFKAMFSRFYH